MPPTPNSGRYSSLAPDSDDEFLPEVGTKNSDGTFYGGGPRNIHCSACAAAGLPKEYGHGHRKGETRYCPCSQKLSAEKNADKQLDPMLRTIADDNIPSPEKQVTATKPGASMTEVMKSLEFMDADSVVMHLAEGQISAAHAKLALLKLMKGADQESKEYLQNCLDNVVHLAPAPEKTKSKTLLPGPLQSAGKLAKLWAAVVKHVKLELHNNGKTEHMRPTQMNVLTGELVMDVKEDEPITSSAVFYLSLEHFRHLVRSRDYLSEGELHSLVAWTATELAVGTRLLLVTRTMEKMLAIMDADMGIELDELIETKASGILSRQTDILGVKKTLPPKQDEGDIFRETANQKKSRKAREKKEKDKEDSGDRVALALEVPNDESCWYWTNGLNCPNKWKVNGVCKYDNKHVCGMPLASGGYCTAKHKAAEHP